MISREETIEWLRENTTHEDWTRGDLIVDGWDTVRKPWETPWLECGSEVITVVDVFPPASPAPATPRGPLFNHIKQALGSRDVEIAGEDHLVGQVKVDAHKARILDNIIKEFKVYPGQDIIIALKARIEVAEESFKPVATPVNRSKPRNKYDREIIPGVYVDVYDVLNAFETGGADVDHGVKKLLAPGDRGIKDEITDLEEAINSIQRRIDHIKEWGGNRG